MKEGDRVGNNYLQSQLKCFVNDPEQYDIKKIYNPRIMQRSRMTITNLNGIKRSHPFVKLVPNLQLQEGN